MPQTGANILLALDIKEAFENVSHQAILERLAALNCSHRTFEYVKTFLINCTAIVGMATIHSRTLTVPYKGTPQRSVISPLLFNVAMIQLAQLHKIEGIQHVLYAEDITLWAAQGSLDDKEFCVQQASICVENYARACGPVCSMEKPELLRIWNSKYNKPNPEDPGHRLRIVLNNQEIPEKALVKFLGM